MTPRLAGLLADGKSANGTLRSVEPDLDGCGFCDLYIQAAPGNVRLVKLYA